MRLSVPIHNTLLQVSRLKFKQWLKRKNGPYLSSQFFFLFDFFLPLPHLFYRGAADKSQLAKKLKPTLGYLLLFFPSFLPIFFFECLMFKLGIVKGEVKMMFYQ